MSSRASKNLHTSVRQVGIPVSSPVFDTLLRLTASSGATSETLEDMLEDALTRGAT